MQNNIPDRYHGRANPFIEHWLKGPECKTIVARQGDRALAIYRDIGHERTGRTKAAARVTTAIGGVRNDRWVATLTVTEPTSMRAATADLNKVLNLMAGF